MHAHAKTIHGDVVGTAARGCCRFLGIPFAKAPVRFMPPEPPNSWAGVLSAQQAGPAAPQAHLPGIPLVSLSGNTRQGEDCLYLNVWTPAPDGARRPVLVWIHGGGFLIGSGSTLMYEGSDLARAHDLVVVTINYRLGALGFLSPHRVVSLPGASNAGLRDQIAALEWVRDNIAFFGGDPDRVTLFGQSAGGMSVSALLGAPRARPLFRRAICQSGAASHVLSAEESDRIARAFLHQLDLDPHLGFAEQVARVPLKRILRAQGRINREFMGLEKLMAFLPAVDGDLLPEQPLRAIERGELAGHELLIGTTLDEWNLFGFLDRGVRMNERKLRRRFGEIVPSILPRAPAPELAAGVYRDALRARRRDPSPWDVWSSLQSQRVFHEPAARLADTQRRGGGRAHTYLFTWRARAPLSFMGAFHALELPFVFGHTRIAAARPFIGAAPGVARLGRNIQGAWAAFARNGDPGHEGLPHWPLHERERRETMVLAPECFTDVDPLGEERRLLSGWAAG